MARVVMTIETGLRPQVSEPIGEWKENEQDEADGMKQDVDSKDKVVHIK